MNKLKKDKAQIILLQETHLSSQEHEKLIKFGYKNIFYSSYSQSHRRGVATLISKNVKFEKYSETIDKEGRYVIVKGNIENNLMTLANIYIPPESEVSTYKTIFDTISKEAEGICVCAGDFNAVLDLKNDTTSSNRSKKHLTRTFGTTLREMGMVDIWRKLHPTEKDYTFFSAPHSVHSRIDYFLIGQEDYYRVSDCVIGVADISDHNSIYLSLNLENNIKNTVWRLNVGLLNSQSILADIKKEIKLFIEENDNGSVDPLILWDSLKAVLRGNLIAKASYLKRKRIEAYSELITELKNKENKFKLKKDNQTQKEIKQIKGQIEQLLDYEIEKRARYIKQSYYELGPKSAKLLARKLRKQQTDSMITRIRNPITQKLERDPKRIENIFYQYYTNLYSQEDTLDLKSTKEFLDRLDLPCIGEAQNKTITAEITQKELDKAISRLKTNKAPGGDGYPIEWYRKFKEELSPLLLRTLNYIHKNGKTPPSWKEAIITLIPKENKDNENCANFRPVSMLNVDYKLYTSILTKRFETFISELIDEDQTGFVSGRQTQDNIRRSLQVIHTITKSKTKAALISLDAEKAFDRVNWDFLYLTLEKFGLKQESIRCIRAIYDNPTARIKVNGSLTNRFQLKRGSRQGCGISPTLFALYIEPLAQAIRQSDDLTGIQVQGREQKIGLFADDVLLFLQDINSSLPKLMKILQTFNSYSGYKLNISKTQVLLFNHKPSEEITTKYNIKWDNRKIKYLGVFLSKDPTSLYQDNYNPINQKIRSDIQRWSTYPLDLTNRINVVKMNILPRLLYLFQSLPIDIPTKQFIEWDRMLSRFIWEGKRPRVRFSTLQLPKDKGGMALPNLKFYFYAAQLRFVCCWCDPGYFAKWKEIESCTDGYQIQTLLGEDSIPNDIRDCLSPITRFTIETWYKVVKQFKLNRERKVLKLIYLDQEFKPAKHDSTFKIWSNKGVTALCTIIKNRKVRSFQDLKTSFELKDHDFFRYLQLREYYDKDIKLSDGEEENAVLGTIIGAYQQRTLKIISKLYNSMMSCQNASTLYVKEKWEQEMSIAISDQEWFRICELAQSSTTSLKWREFNWKNLIRFFITPRIKSKQLLSQQLCWRQCGMINANHTHIFWDCTQIVAFWTSLHSALTQILRYSIPFAPATLYLGNVSEIVANRDEYLVKILLTSARKAVTRRWLKPEPPSLTEWMDIVQEIFTMEKMTFTLRLKEEKIMDKWDKWITYQNTLST